MDNTPMPLCYVYLGLYSGVPIRCFASKTEADKWVKDKLPNNPNELTLQGIQVEYSKEQWDQIYEVYHGYYDNRNQKWRDEQKKINKENTEIINC